MAEFKFESKVEPLQVIWQSLLRLFKKVIDGLDGIISGPARGAALLLCLCKWDSQGRAQTQGISESAAVAAGCNRLAWGKHATTLAILTQFKSQQGFNALTGIGEKLLLTKASPIASLNHSIIHLSLNKNMTKEQNHMFWIESCGKQQVWIDDLSYVRGKGVCWLCSNPVDEGW